MILSPHTLYIQMIYSEKSRNVKRFDANHILLVLSNTHKFSKIADLWLEAVLFGSSIVMKPPRFRAAKRRLKWAALSTITH
jgi:hypothetical protein